MNLWQDASVPLAILFAGMSVAAWMTFWMSSRFQEIRELVYSQSEKLRLDISRKMEYHEQHDDARFIALNNDIWAIKLRNAAKDGILVEVEQTIAQKDQTHRNLRRPSR